MGESTYAMIKKETVCRARERVLNDIAAITQGEPDKVISLVEEYQELDAICAEFNKRKAAE